MKIKKLSSEVQTSLRTGIIITDMTQCISELVQNSLDAKATSVAVRVDLENFTIQVVDNGHGLTKEELDLIGNRYMTSKCYSLKDLKRNLNYYGFRGESLASIQESCGVLMIISKTEGSDQTYSKVFRANIESHSAFVSCHNRLCVGTTVIVKDFLYNLPVRRARIQPAIEMEYIRHCLVALSIINYKVSFTLRNDATKLVVFQTQEFKDTGDALKYHCSMKEDHSLIPVSSSIAPFKISAYISRETEQSGHFQFVYVNGRLIKNKSVYKHVNKILSKSFYLRNIGKEIKANDENPKEKTSPVFIIHIQCPYSEYDVCADPKKLKVEFKKWDVVLQNLEKVIDTFVLSESNLNTATKPESSQQVERYNNISTSDPAYNDNYTVKSNVLSGIPVKRRTSKPNNFEDTSKESIQINCVKTNSCSNEIIDTRKKTSENEGKVRESIVESLNLYNSNNNLPTEKSGQLENANEGQKKMASTNPSFNKKLNFEKKKTKNESRMIKSNEVSLASAETVLAILRKKETKKKLNNEFESSNSSCKNESNSSMNCASKSDIENPLPFKVPKPICRPLKRKRFTEHILTESESDVSSAKQRCSSMATHSREDISNLKSILPIQSREFFNNALENMVETRNVLLNLVETPMDETPRQAFQINVYRALKKIPSSKALQLTKRNTFKFLDCNKGCYINCSQGTKSTVISEETLINEPASKCKAQRMGQNLMFSEISKQDIKILSDKNKKMRKNSAPVKSNSFISKKLKTHKLEQNWKLFSPTFAKIKTPKSLKSILKSKAHSNYIHSLSKSTSLKPALPIKHIKTSSVKKYVVSSQVPSSSNHACGKIHSNRSILKLQECKGLIKNKNHPGKCKSKSFAVKFSQSCNTSKMQDAATQTYNELFDIRTSKNVKDKHNTNKINSQVQIHEETKYPPHLNETCSNSNPIGVEKPSSHRYKNLQIEKNTSLLRTITTPPTCINYSIKDSNTKTCDKNNVQQSRYLTTTQEIVDTPVNVSFLNHQKTPSMFHRPSSYDTYYKDSLVHGYNRYSMNFISSSNNQYSHTCSKYNEASKNVTSMNNSVYTTDLRNCAQGTRANDFHKEKHLSDLKTHEFSSVMPYQGYSNGELVKDYFSESGKQHNILQFNDSNNGTLVRESSNKFIKEMFELTPHRTPEILKICQLDHPHQEQDTNVPPLMVDQETPSKAFLTTEHSVLHKENVEHLTPYPNNDEKFSHSFVREDADSNDGNGNSANCLVKERDLFCENITREHLNSLDDVKETRNLFIKKELYDNNINIFQQPGQSNFTYWNKEIISNGKTIYVNNLTGMSYFTTPKADDMNTTYVLHNRHWFLPKGASPLLHINDDTRCIAKQLSETEKNIVENIVNSNNIELATVKWRSDNNMQGIEKIFNMLSVNEKNGDWSSLIENKKPCSFSAESLTSAQVIGQVDNKFIAALLQPNKEVNMFLVLFDQHAVDERIRLETLMSGYKKTDGQLEIHVLNPNIEINLSENEIAILKELLPRMSKLGLNLLLQENKVTATSIPLCIYNRYAKEGQNNELLGNAVKVLMRQLLLSAQETRGVIPSMPPFMSDVISSEACRGAIKFGDVLTLDVCKLLISKLATCEVPFQCAHGRPVLTPLVEIKPLEHMDETIDLRKLTKRAETK